MSTVLCLYCERLMDCFTARWLVLERCIGDLGNMLIQVKETTESKRILVQVAVGLAYLHGQRIVHRDLKPENILVQRCASDIFVLKLADFGFSKKQQQDDDGKFSFDDMGARGTSGYMAPEVLNSSNPKKNFESDVWALGVVFFYVLSDGKHPLGERILNDHLNVDMRDTVIQLAKDLRHMGPISHDWMAADLVTQLLQYNPEDRPKSFTVAYHPYFSLTNETTKGFLAKQVYEIYGRDEAFLVTMGRDEVGKWYGSLQQSLQSADDEEGRQELLSVLEFLVIIDSLFLNEMQLTSSVTGRGASNGRTKSALSCQSHR